METGRSEQCINGAPYSADILQDLSAFMTLATSLSPDYLLDNLEQALDLLRNTTGSESAELFLAEPDGRDMLLTVYRGPFRRAFCQRLRFAPGEGFPGLVLAHGQPILTSTLAGDIRYLRDTVKKKGYCSYVCVPLFAGQAVLGAICVGSRCADDHLDDKLRLLTWMSFPIATALQASLLQAGQSVIPSEIQIHGDDGDLDRLLLETLRRVRQLAHADSGALTMFNQFTEGVAHRVTDGTVTESACPIIHHSRSSPGCPALDGGHGVVLYDARHSWPFSCRCMHRPGSAMYCLPMRIGGAMIGVIQLFYRNTVPFPPTRHLGILLEVAEQTTAIVSMVRGHADQGPRSETVSWQGAQAQNESAALIAFPRATNWPSCGSAREIHTAFKPFLRIRCFGSFELFREGMLLTPQMFKRRAALSLLKILLLHAGHSVTKDALIEYLWPETDSQTGTNRLHGAVHALRKVIEPGDSNGRWVFIHNDGDHYMFESQEPCWLDLAEFRAAIAIGRQAEENKENEAAIQAFDAAVRLYRGDLLEDDRFAEWCLLERESLRESYLAALQRLAALYAKAGDRERTIGGYRQILRNDPLREPVLRQLMECLWQTGHRDEALHQYELFRQLLWRELDMTPLPETEELAHRMRSLPPR